MAARSLRNGKKYAEFEQTAVIIRDFRVTDLITRHIASAPENSDSDGEDDSPQDEDPPEDEPEPEPELQQPCPASPSATSKSFPLPNSPNPAFGGRGILNAARRRWQPTPTTHSAPPCTSIPSDPDAARKQKKTEKHHQARRVKREQLRETAGKPKAVSKRRAHESPPIILDFEFSSHPGVASTGWMGLRVQEADFIPEAREYAFEEAKAIPGMRVLDWQGIPGPLVDGGGYIFGVLGGHPRDPDWVSKVAELAANLMREAAENMYDRTFSGVYYGTRKEEKKKRAEGPIPRHGPHRAKGVGNSMGGGQEFPTAFFHTVLNAIILTGLLAQNPFRRITGFTTRA
ncbi:hypothetical protein K438DRAFT_1996129 [Mycena galopus ATCC 62051]|nr:hypothetical protein K438DRAFT_1996129 [Mycena galopus ATCC 62051]